MCILGGKWECSPIFCLLLHVPCCQWPVRSVVSTLPIYFRVDCEWSWFTVSGTLLSVTRAFSPIYSRGVDWKWSWSTVSGTLLSVAYACSPIDSRGVDFKWSWFTVSGTLLSVAYACSPIDSRGVDFKWSWFTVSGTLLSVARACSPIDSRGVDFKWSWFTVSGTLLSVAYACSPIDSRGVDFKWSWFTVSGTLLSVARACSPIYFRGVDCREAFDDKRKENIRSCTTHCTEDACNHAPSNIPVNHMLILLTAILFRVCLGPRPLTTYLSIIFGWPLFSVSIDTQIVRYMDPFLVQCWANVVD